MPIRVFGAREHNLRNLSLTLPDGFTVVTGVSGSGKSSLVFDTIYHEARRRFADVFGLDQERPADVDSIVGLGPAVAIGQDLLNRNPGSTVATASGIHPLLRIAYARFGTRRCPGCGAEVGVSSVDEASVVAARLAPVEVRASLQRESPGTHTTLLRLLGERRSADGCDAIVVDGRPVTRKELDGGLHPKVRHSISLVIGTLEGGASVGDARRLVEAAAETGASGLIFSSAETSEYLSLAPVCGRCARPLPEPKPVHFHSHCPACEGEGCDRCRGTGEHPQAVAVTMEGKRLSELLRHTSGELARQDWRSIRSQEIREELAHRLGLLSAVGLDYVALDRPSPTLSRGESQRLRLAMVLVAPLENMTHVLDEPTVGQHAEDVARLVPMLKRLPGRVVCVEHDEAVIRSADTVVDLGPGGGPAGGALLFLGTPENLRQTDTPTGRALRAKDNATPAAEAHRDVRPDWFRIEGAEARNLRSIDIAVPEGALTCVCGVSGSGKTSLVFEAISPSVAEGTAVGCRSFEGRKARIVAVDQGPIGRNPRSTPATYTKLADSLRDLFAEYTGLSASHFSYNRPEGACPDCDGIGAIEVTLKHLPSRWLTCATCGGRRFREEVEAARVDFAGRRLSIGELYATTVGEAADLFADLDVPAAEKVRRVLSTLVEVGLGYLQLGQPSPTLSGGEAQRTKLAKFLHAKRRGCTLMLLDEPTTGLHSRDVGCLLRVLERITAAGTTVVVIEHNLDVVRSADWIIELGPGSGPAGGRVLYQGKPAGLGRSDSPTGRAIRGIGNIAIGTDAPPARDRIANRRMPDAIEIRGARANNLRGIDVAIPHRAITVVTGPSGCGKTSLVRDVLETEARNRAIAGLSMYERQNASAAKPVDVESICGLGVAATVRPTRSMHNPRTSVGSVARIDPALTAIMARSAVVHCPDCRSALSRCGTGELSCPRCSYRHSSPGPQHFSPRTYSAACTHCSGVGVLFEPNPDKLIRRPDRPLCDGAMHSPGFFPNGYLCKPGNGGYDVLRALARRYQFDPEKTPWNEMPEAARRSFLFGDEEPLLVHHESKQGKTYTRTERFSGFYAWIGDWDTSGTYTDSVTCPECAGSGLREPYRSATLDGCTIAELRAMTLGALRSRIEALAKTGEADSQRLADCRARIGFLIAVGLPYLSLNRRTGTLSAGEAQRVRLAALLSGGLSDLTVLLDEPSRGLHPREVAALVDALRRIRDSGNTVVVVEHDPEIIAAADHEIALGPGAGRDGGALVSVGKPDPTARRPSICYPDESRGCSKSPPRRMTVVGACENNLDIPELRIPLGVVVGVCGVSGSGKSTLVVDTIGRALAPIRHTTSIASEPVDPGRHEAILGAPESAVVVTQSRGGLSSAADYFGLPRSFARAYERESDGDLAADDLLRRCNTCGGAGVLRTDLGFLMPISERCEVCGGTGYSADAANRAVRGHSFSQVLSLTVDEARSIWHDVDRIRAPLDLLSETGLGYLVLNQPGRTLSGGEIQRLKIVKELNRRTRGETLYILDEPTTGQSRREIAMLVAVLRRLTEAGEPAERSTVLVLEHSPDFLASCDWLVELGPGGGPDGGRVVAEGPPIRIAEGSTPTAPYLAHRIGRDSPDRHPHEPPPTSSTPDQRSPGPSSAPPPCAEGYS